MTRTRYVLMAMILLSACSGGGAGDSGADAQALVSLATVQRTDVSQAVTLYGAVEIGPQGRDVLFTPVEAQLVQIEAPVGSSVKKGQPVVRLKAGPNAQLALAQARSDAAAANDAFARAQRLKADGLVSEADVNSARASSNNAQALLDSLEARAGGLVLTAPADGMVESINASAGDLVPAGNAVATLVRSDAGVRVRFGIDPALSRKIDPAANIEVRVAGLEMPLTAAIASIDSVVDQTTRLASIYVSLPPDSPATPGEAVTGHVLVRTSVNALTIPYAALLDDGGQPYVYVASDGHAERRDVVTGATDGQTVAIAQGLAEGDKVVVEGGTALEDGMKVRLQ